MATTTCQTCGQPVPAAEAACSTCGATSTFATAAGSPTTTPQPVTPHPIQAPSQTPAPPPAQAPASPPTAWPPGGHPPTNLPGTTTGSVPGGAVRPGPSAPLLTVRNLRFLVGGGIALLFFSSFLPWATVWFITVNGLDGDGTITAFLSVVAGVLFGVGVKQSGEGRTVTGWIIGSLVASLLTFGVYVLNLFDVLTTGSDPDELIQVNASPNMGLILGPIAGIAAVAGLVLLLRKNAESAPPPPPPAPPPPLQ